MADSSNTGENRKQKPGTFEKGVGKDPRINRKGRPKSFDAWRALAKSIAAEPATNKDGLVLIRIPLLKNGAPVRDEQGRIVMVDHYATNVEMIARTWLKDPRHQTELIEAAFGKVPLAVDVSGAVIHIVRVGVDPDKV